MLKHHMALVFDPSWSRQSLVAAWFIIVFLLWKIHKLSRCLFADYPKNLRMVQQLPLCGKWINGLNYLFSGAKTITQNYENGVPYAVPTPESYNVLVSSQQQIKELGWVSESQLSFRAVGEEIIQPRYTMDGFALDTEMRQKSRIGKRVLEGFLTPKLPSLLPILRESIELVCSEVIPVQGESSGWGSISAYGMCQLMTVKVSSIIFAGKELGRNPAYTKAASLFPQMAFITGEVLRATPSWLASYVTRLLTGGSHSYNTLMHLLVPAFEDRLRTSRPGRSEDQKPLDCIQWLIEAAPKSSQWTARRLAQEMIALWLAAAHQPSMASYIPQNPTLNAGNANRRQTFVFAIYDLCLHPEYLDPLREEAQRLWESGDLQFAHDMPLFDSFLKESARLNPGDSTNIRRKARAPYTFADGTYVPEGSWVSIPQRAIMRDSGFYSSPEAFDGFRFVTDTKVMPTAKFTNTDPKFPFWGLGKRACPGRHYVSVMLKMLLSYLVLNYEFKLSDEHALRTFSWRSILAPRSSTKLLIRRRV